MLGAEPEVFRQKAFAVGAEDGRGFTNFTRGAAKFDRDAGNARGAGDRMLDLKDHVPGYDLLVGDDFVDRVDWSAGDTGFVKHLLPFFAGFCHETLCQNRAQGFVVLVAQRIGLKARVFGNIQFHQLAQSHPEAVVTRRHHEGGGLGAERFEGHNGGMAVANRMGHLAGEFVAGDGVFKDGDLAVEHGNVHHLPQSGALAFMQRGKDADRAEKPGRDIPDGRADAGRLTVRLTRDAHHTAHRLDHRVVRRSAAVGTGLPVAGRRGINQTRVDFFEHVVAQAQFFHRTRAVVFNQNVHLFDQGFENLFALGGFQVEGKALLVAVQAHEISALTIFVRTIRP